MQMVKIEDIVECKEELVAGYFQRGEGLIDGKDEYSGALKE